MTKMNIKQIQAYSENHTPFDKVVVLVHSTKGSYNNFGTLSDLSNIDFGGIQKLVIHDKELVASNLTGVDEIEISPPTPLFKPQCKQSDVHLFNCGMRKVTANGVGLVFIKGANALEEVNTKAAHTIHIEETPQLESLKASKTDMLVKYSVVNAPNVVLSHELHKAVTRISMAEAEDRRAYEEKYAAHNATLFRNSL